MTELSERDLAVLWHPATHFDDTRTLPPEPIVGAAGVWLHTADGRAILDGISSWWTSVHGHGHPAIVAAVQAQVARLDHVMFAVDYPYQETTEAVRFMRTASLPDEDLQKIAHRNAERIFRIAPQPK